MNISIVIANYNGEELLRENLPKVLTAAKQYEANTKNTVELIVVDDCSTDDSLKEIQNLKFKNQNYSSKFKIIKNEKNLGFSSTVNRGVKEARGEIVVLLNTDVVPEMNFLQPLVKYFANEKVFAVGCMDKSVEKGKAVLRGRGVGRWEKGFLVHARGEVDKTDTLWVAGGSGAFRKSLWQKLGGFDTLYNPFYWEDIDLSYRALKSGYKIFFEPKSIVTHEHEKGSIKRKYSPFQIKIIAYRNQFIFVWINITDSLLQLQHVLWLPYHFVKALIQTDIAFFIGFFMAVVKLPKIIPYNSKQQKLFKKTDREIFNQFII